MSVFMCECTLFLLTFYWTILLHCVHTVAGVAYCSDDCSQCLAIFSLGINIWLSSDLLSMLGYEKKERKLLGLQTSNFEPMNGVTIGICRNYHETTCVKGYKWLKFLF